MSAPNTTRGRVDDPQALRDEWLSRLSNLTNLVRSWAEELDWSTRQIEKKMKDSRLGSYEAPALLMQKGTTRVLLDPVARFVPGAEGLVDLYLMPAYDDVASLYYVGGDWRLHPVFPNAAAVAKIKEADSSPLSKETLGRVLDEMITDAPSPL